MLNKIRLFIFLILCTLLLAGCGQTDEPEDGIDIYYLTKNYDQMHGEKHALVGEKITDQIDMASAWLATTPKDGLHVAVIGNEFKVTRVVLAEKNLTLTVDEGYRKLDPIREVLTRAALVRTYEQIDGIDYVAMQIGEEALCDASGTPYGPMNSSNFIENAGDEINTYEKARLKLFLANSTGDGLVEVTKNVVYNTNISMDKLIVEEILSGGDGVSSFRSVAEGTKLVNVSTKDGTCYVNLNETFLQTPVNVTPAVSVYSIVNSLAELPNVNKIQISVNGEQAVTLRDNLSLDTSFERNLELVNQ